MIRIGIGKPYITQAAGRWGEPSPVFYVTPFGWVDVDKWMKLQWYQSPFLDNLSWLPVETIEKMVKQKLALSPQGAVWEFDALASDLEERVRFVAFFEKPGLVRWTWWDANVVYPFLRAVAWVRTKLGTYND